MRQFVLAFTVIFLIPTVGISQGSDNVLLLAHVNSYASVGYNDCWGYTAPDGREYALLGVRNGTSIVDITNTPSVVEIAFIPGPGSTWKDIKTYRHFAYVVNETGGGMQIIDLSNLPNSATLVATYTGLSTSHNISIDTANAMLYAEGEQGFAIRAISLANPLQPVQVSTFGIPCHDVYAVNNTVYASEGGYGSIGIFDLSNPVTPVLRGRFSIPSSGYVHNCWLTDDGRYVMTTEETNGRSVKFWDINNLDSVRMTSQYFASPFLAHNTHIKGDYAYISYYADGLRIVDISDPGNIVEVGYYDTWPGPGGGFDGAWGAYPYFNSGKVLISDIQSGLYVVFFQAIDPLDPNPPRNARAYSDYATPSSMRVFWSDPVTRVNGAPLATSEFVVEVKRNSQLVAQVPGGMTFFIDTGLVDGQRYTYTLQARLVPEDSLSGFASTTWIAGGSPIPRSPTNLSVGGTGARIVLRWQNPARNLDNTPMDDFGGVHLYQNGVLQSTYTRVSTDTAAIDSVVMSPTGQPPFTWHLVAFDTEQPSNISVPSQSISSPLYAPLAEDFSGYGQPNPRMWTNSNGHVNNKAWNPTSPPYALNLDGKPTGVDIVDLKPVNLVGLSGSGLLLSYAYQPGGNADPPEPDDSLFVYLKSSTGEWLQLRSYAGTTVQPFQTESFLLDTIPSGSGTFFFEGFQVRFRSQCTRSVIGYIDDWFIDDFSLGFPVSVAPTADIPLEIQLHQNFPNPFNPGTSIRFDLPRSGPSRLVVYDVLGRLVAKLVEGYKSAGVHEVSWDGKDIHGQPIGSGLYFYRLEAEGYSIAKKMMVVR